MKRLFLLLLVALLLTGCVRYKDGERVTPVEEEETEEVEETATEPEEEPEEEVEEEPVDEEEAIIEHNEELLFAEYKIDNIKTEIENDEFKITFDWTNQSGKEDVAFTALGYFDVYQGDEPLEEVSGAYDPTSNSLLLRKTPNGVTVPGEATYKLVNDEPIKVRFGATHESDDTKEEIVIDIK